MTGAHAGIAGLERAPTWQIITDLEHAKELHIAGLLWCRRCYPTPQGWFYLRTVWSPPHPEDYGVYEFGVKLEE